jgi:hypothetical protein
VLRGVVGTIKWGFYTAAAINGYTVTKEQNGQWVLTATVVLSDAFKMNLADHPLTFVAKHAKGEWSWPIESYRFHEGLTGPMTAKLGPPLQKGVLIRG